MTKAIWEKLFANEIGRLVQGVATRILSRTNTVFFIPIETFLAGRTVTYGKIASKIWPQKAEIYCTWLTVVWHFINFPGDVTKSTADIKTAKIIFYSVLLTKKEKFIWADIVKFYSNNPIDIYEYIKLPLYIIPA